MCFAQTWAPEAAAAESAPPLAASHVGLTSEETRCEAFHACTLSGGAAATSLSLAGAAASGGCAASAMNGAPQDDGGAAKRAAPRPARPPQQQVRRGLRGDSGTLRPRGLVRPRASYAASCCEDASDGTQLAVLGLHMTRRDMPRGSELRPGCKRQAPQLRRIIASGVDADNSCSLSKRNLCRNQSAQENKQSSHPSHIQALLNILSRNLPSQTCLVASHRCQNVKETKQTALGTYLHVGTTHAILREPMRNMIRLSARLRGQWRAVHRCLTSSTSRVSSPV